MKKCTCCGESKPLEDYYLVNKKSHKRVARCKKCAVKAAISDYKANEAKKKEYLREYNVKNKELLRIKRAARYQANKELHASRGRKWREANADKQRDYSFKKTYGISVEEYEAMALARDNKCELCSGTNVDGRRLSVDHCHASGKIRGLLCNSCNLALGMFKDDIAVLERAINYVRRHRE